MARFYGRCPKGRRGVASVPHGHWQSSTFIAALRAERITAPFLIEGAVNPNSTVGEVRLLQFNDLARFEGGFLHYIFDDFCATG